MANVAPLYDGNKLSHAGIRFAAYVENEICNAADLRDAHAEDGLEVPSDELVDAEAELARLYAIKEALTNLPLHIMIVNVLEGIQSNDHDDQCEAFDTKDEEELESLQALIRADMALINECLR